MVAMIVLSTTPTVSTICSRKAWLIGENGRNEASSITARHCSSNSTGRTTMLTGVPSPSPVEIRSDVLPTLGTRIVLRSKAAWPTRPSPERYAVATPFRAR